jgi:hypothetical protein
MSFWIDTDTDLAQGNNAHGDCTVNFSAESEQDALCPNFKVGNRHLVPAFCDGLNRKFPQKVAFVQ